jgi:hypothetical protein
LKAIVLIPKAVNQIPTTGQAAKKKCKERELLKLAYWKIYNVVSFFFLPESVTFISRFIFCGFPDQTRSYQGTMHSTKKGAAEYTSYTYLLIQQALHYHCLGNTLQFTIIILSKTIPKKTDEELKKTFHLSV